MHLASSERNVEIRHPQRLRQTSVSWLRSRVRNFRRHFDEANEIRIHATNVAISSWSNFTKAPQRKEVLRPPQAKVSWPEPRAREKVSRMRLIIKERERERKARGKTSRKFSFSFSPVRWQNWILVKAPSRSADRHRHFRVARLAQPRFLSFPSFPPV